jgi:hypothetical protein
METNEKDLKPEESLQIIEQMIQKAKTNLHDSSFYFLLWGWIILIAIIGEKLLANFTDYSKTYYVWFIVIPGFIASLVYGAIKGRKTKVLSHLDRLNSLNWLVFLISYTIVLIFMKSFNYQVAPIIFLLAGNATFITGIIIKFKPLVIGGIVFWIGVICQFVFSKEYNEFIYPLIIVLGYLVPGYLLKFQHKKNA